MKPIDRRVHQLLDGELPPHEATTLRAELQRSPDALLDLALLEHVRPVSGHEPPPLPAGFERRVMARVASRPAPRTGLLTRWLERSVFGLMPVGSGALAGMALALLGAGLFVGYRAGVASGDRAPEVEVAVAPGVPTNGPQKTLVRFALRAPGARKVELVGSFNGWGAEGIALSRAGDQGWVASVELPKGHYEYTFVIDGERWVPDPAAGQLVEDGFGGHNAVIEL